MTPRFTIPSIYNGSGIYDTENLSKPRRGLNTGDPWCQIRGIPLIHHWSVARLKIRLRIMIREHEDNDLRHDEFTRLQTHDRQGSSASVRGSEHRERRAKKAHTGGQWQAASNISSDLIRALSLVGACARNVPEAVGPCNATV